MLIRYLPVLCLATLGASKLVQHGWLDRMVAYHKKNFIAELSRLPSPLTVTVEKAPPGFVDSPNWDKQSVLRLVMLVEVLDAKPVQHAIRRALSPSRRIYLPRGMNSFDIFPSWSKDAPNNFDYDDMVSYDDKGDKKDFGAYTDSVMDEDTVLYISNPIEAHLPSARITVRLLREIMETRAAGLRVMPTTTRSTRSWATKSTTNSTGGSTADANDTTAAGGSTAEHGSTAADGSTDKGASTAAGDIHPDATKESTEKVATTETKPTEETKTTIKKE